MGCSFQTEADESALREPVPVVFSGEEGGGRYMDLHTHFHRFVNAKFGRQMDYTAFVAELPGTQDVPRALTLGQPYRCVRMWSCIEAHDCVPGNEQLQ